MAIHWFERAEVVLGSHGGALYNALWANRDCKVVEILPVLSSGAYLGQQTTDGSPISRSTAFF
jgi:capsular polysaccharide biosynthesis protein